MPHCFYKITIENDSVLAIDSYESDIIEGRKSGIIKGLLLYKLKKKYD